MTIADISAACELAQTKAIAFDLNKWPKVEAWFKLMIFENPTILEVNQHFLKFAN